MGFSDFRIMQYTVGRTLTPEWYSCTITFIGAWYKFEILPNLVGAQVVKTAEIYTYVSTTIIGDSKSYRIFVTFDIGGLYAIMSSSKTAMLFLEF